MNANIHYYVKTAGGFKLAGSNNDRVGKNMTTKAAGSDSGLIVTSSYKFPEGSTEEAAALGRDDEKPTPPKGDVDIAIVAEKGVPYGQDLKAKLVLTSKADSTRTVQYVVRLAPVTYVGALGSVMTKMSDSTTLHVGGVYSRCGEGCVCMCVKWVGGCTPVISHSIQHIYAGCVVSVALIAM